MNRKKNFSSAILVIFIGLMLVLFDIYLKITITDAKILLNKENETKSYYIAESSILEGIHFIKTEALQVPSLPSQNDNIDTGNNPEFIYTDEERVIVPDSEAVIYTDNNIGVNGRTDAARIIKVDNFYDLIREHKNILINDIYSQIAYAKSKATTYNVNNVSEILNIINSINAPHIYIKVGNLVVSENVIFGNTQKSVTLIVDNLIINSSVNIKVYGQLIVTNINANGFMNFEIVKCKDQKGDFFCENLLIFNKEGTHKIDGTLYARSIILNQGGVVSAGRIITDNEFITDKDSEVNALLDMIVGTLICNQSQEIFTGGDLIVANNFTKNKELKITAGGRVVVGNNMTLNGDDIIIQTGGNTSSIKFEGDYTTPVYEDKYVILKEIEKDNYFNEYKAYNYSYLKIEYNGLTKQSRIFAKGIYKKEQTCLECIISHKDNSLTVLDYKEVIE